jgi:hypothetical protein
MMSISARAIALWRGQAEFELNPEPPEFGPRGLDRDMRTKCGWYLKPQGGVR